MQKSAQIILLSGLGRTFVMFRKYHVIELPMRKLHDTYMVFYHVTMAVSWLLEMILLQGNLFSLFFFVFFARNFELSSKVVNVFGDQSLNAAAIPMLYRP